MTHLRSFTRTAFQGMRARPMLHLTALIILSLAVFSSAAAFYISGFVRSYFDEWGARAEMTVYLKPHVDEETAQVFFQKVQSSQIGKAKLVSPAEAMERLKKELRDDADVLENLPSNPLVWTVEITPSAAYSRPETLEPAAQALAAEKEVDDVDYGREWFDRFSSLADAARYLSAVFLVFILASAIAVASLTMRLTANARREEIDLLRLVGATETFVQTPFLITGVFLGAAASVCAFLGLAALDVFLLPAVEQHLRFLLGERGLPPLATSTAFLGTLSSGIVLGGLGSAISIRRSGEPHK